MVQSIEGGIQVFNVGASYVFTAPVQQFGTGTSQVGFNTGMNAQDGVIKITPLTSRASQGATQLIIVQSSTANTVNITGAASSQTGDIGVDDDGTITVTATNSQSPTNLYSRKFHTPVAGSNFTPTNILNVWASGTGVNRFDGNINMTIGSASAALLTNNIINQTAGVNPVGTTSTTFVMMAVGGSITPTLSTRILVIMSGQIVNNTTGDGAVVRLKYGTGTAPINGAAESGTTLGSGKRLTDVTGLLAQGVPFAISGIITGATAGTPLWLDAALEAVTGGTANILNVDIIAYELP